MQSTQLLRPHTKRDTIQTDPRKQARLVQQSALLAVELHAPGEVRLVIDRSVAMDALCALTEWVRERERWMGRSGDASTLDLNLHCVRMRLLVRDLASAIEESGRDTLPRIDEVPEAEAAGTAPAED